MTTEPIPAENCIFGFKPARLVTPPAIVAGVGAWQADYPAGQMLALPVSQVARTAALALADTQAAVTYAKPVKIGLVVLIRHNLSAAAKIRVTVYADQAMTTLLWDSGWLLAWESVFDVQSPFVDWEGGRLWDRTYTADEMKGRSWDRRVLLPKAVYGQAVHVEIDDQLNPDGFVRVGFLEVADALQMPINYSFGAKYGFRGRSKVQEAEGGTKYRQRLPKPRLLVGQFELIDHQTALTTHLEMIDQLDITEPFYIWPEPLDPISSVRTAMFGTYTQLDPIDFALAGLDTSPFAFEEEI